MILIEKYQKPYNNDSKQEKDIASFFTLGNKVRVSAQDCNLVQSDSYEKYLWKIESFWINGSMDYALWTNCLIIQNL